MREEINQTTIEKNALICWYYQCRKYTPTRISVITHMDINEVKTILRRNCSDYAYNEKLERTNLHTQTYGQALGLGKC